jgi:hypothetical protein
VGKKRERREQLLVPRSKQHGGFNSKNLEQNRREEKALRKVYK